MLYIGCEQLQGSIAALIVIEKKMLYAEKTVELYPLPKVGSLILKEGGNAKGVFLRGLF